METVELNKDEVSAIRELVNTVEIGEHTTEEQWEAFERFKTFLDIAVEKPARVIARVMLG